MYRLYATFVVWVRNYFKENSHYQIEDLMHCEMLLKILCSTTGSRIIIDLVLGQNYDGNSSEAEYM